MDWRKQVGIVDSFPSYHARSLTAFSPTMDNVRMGENDHFLREVCTGMFRPQAFQQLGLLASALCPRGASMSGCRANLPATPPQGAGKAGQRTSQPLLGLPPRAVQRAGPLRASWPPPHASPASEAQLPGVRSLAPWSLVQLLAQTAPQSCSWHAIANIQLKK